MTGVVLRSFALVVLALLLAGCPRARPTTLPQPLAPARTATLEAEVRALAEARAHFENGRYDTSARLLRHFLELHPHTSSAVQARWILGRADEELGEWHAALAQYRMITLEATRSPGLTEAMNTQVRDRISMLTRTLGRASPATSGFVAIALDPAHLPDPSRWEQWLTPLLAEGLTTLIIDVAPAARPTPAPGATEAHGVYFQTTWAKLQRDLFTELVPLAHDLGLTVFASLDLTQMPWLDPTLGWTTYVMDDQNRHLIPSQSFDLLHPAVQDYLSGFLSDLARTQVDGLITILGSHTGPRRHLSAKGLAQFAQGAGLDLDAERMLRYGRSLSLLGRDGTVKPSAADPTTGMFWRYAGWQARERLNVLARLRTAMRQQRTGFQVALAFHDLALTNGALGLLEHGEDLLEATQRGFSVAIPLAALSPSAGVGQPAQAGGGFSDQVHRVLDLVGSAERVWMLEPVTHLDRMSVARLLNSAPVKLLRASGLHLVITAPSP